MQQCRKNVSDSQGVLKELYEKAEFAQKKMIVNCLIRRVDVCRDYKLKIDFNFDFQQFINGIDSVA